VKGGSLELRVLLYNFSIGTILIDVQSQTFSP